MPLFIVVVYIDIGVLIFGIVIDEYDIGREAGPREYLLTGGHAMNANHNTLTPTVTAGQGW